MILFIQCFLSIIIALVALALAVGVVFCSDYLYNVSLENFLINVLMLSVGLFIAFCILGFGYFGLYIIWSF